MLPRSSPLPILGVLLVMGAASAWAQELDSDVVIEVHAASDPVPPGATEVRLTEARAVDELGDVLAREAGVVVRSLGGLGAWTGVSLRGASFRTVQVHLDGVPLNPDGVDAVNLAELPLLGLGSVWVFRGRVPATYGASPVGGLLDLRTTSASGGRLFASAGSFGSVRTGGLAAFAGALGAVPSEGSVAVDLLGTRGDFAFFDDGGTVYTPDDDSTRLRAANGRFQVSAQGRWRLGDRSRWTLLDTAVHRDEQLPGPIGVPAVDARLVTTRNLAVLQGEGRTGSAGTIAARAWHLVRVETLDDQGGEVGVGSQLQRDTGHTVGAAIDGAVAVRPWLKVAGSATGRWEQFSRLQLATDLPEPARWRAVAGAAVESAFYVRPGRIAVVPSVDLRVVAPDASAVEVRANPGLVLSSEPVPGLSLRLAGGGVFRPPDLTELYGDRGAIVGNAALRPESGWNGDLTVAGEGRAGDWQLAGSASGFVVALADRITWIQNAQRTVVPVNLGQSLAAGVELSLRADWRGWLSASTALTVNESRDGEGRYLPFVPPVGLDHALTGTWPDHLAITWDLHVTGSTFTDADNVREQPVRVLHGLAARVELAPGAPWVELAVRNLGDQRTSPVDRDPIGADNTPVNAPVVDFFGYPLPGRTLWVTLGWTPGRKR